MSLRGLSLGRSNLIVATLDYCARNDVIGLSFIQSNLALDFTS